MVEGNRHSEVKTFLAFLVLPGRTWEMEDWEKTRLGSGLPDSLKSSLEAKPCSQGIQPELSYCTFLEGAILKEGNDKGALGVLQHEGPSWNWR